MKALLKPTPGPGDQHHSQAYNTEQDLDWERRAAINPLFAVMSEDVFQHSTAAPTPAELAVFYNKGKLIWNRYFDQEWQTLQQFQPAEKAKILEYGSGMGRVLSVPASKGAEVCGVDISPTQVALAEKYFPFPGAQFKVLEDGRIPWAAGEFEFVYTFAVFQHIKQTSVLLKAIREMCRVLKKGGAIKVQMPTIQRNQFSPGERKYIWSVSFDEHSLVFYWMKRLPFLPMLRLVSHTNLSGAAFYIELPRVLKSLRSSGIQITKVEFSTGVKPFVLITGQKA